MMKNTYLDLSLDIEKLFNISVVIINDYYRMKCKVIFQLIALFYENDWKATWERWNLCSENVNYNNNCNKWEFPTGKTCIPHVQKE